MSQIKLAYFSEQTVVDEQITSKQLFSAWNSACEQQT